MILQTQRLQPPGDTRCHLADQTGTRAERDALAKRIFSGLDAAKARAEAARLYYLSSSQTDELDRDPVPMRVRNIFICAGVVFCASSRMMNASLRVRPRM